MSWEVEHLSLVSFAALVATAVAAIVVFYIFHRIMPDKSWVTAFASVVVAIGLAVLISPWLNHLRAVQRDLAAREWTLKQQHLTRLRPVLHLDADRMVELARRMRTEGHLLDLTRGAQSVQAEEVGFWLPDIMSPHLKEHFSEYHTKKENLQRAVHVQDERYRDLYLLLEGNFKAFTVGAVGSRELARATVEKCMGKGPGMRLIVGKDSYSYNLPGGLGGAASGQVTRDLLSSFQAFKSFTPDADILSRCKILQERADEIEIEAKALSKEASLLGERNDLAGFCAYLRVE